MTKKKLAVIITAAVLFIAALIFTHVTDAGCPDKICVNHGELRTEMLPIVCLPNRLIITYR